MVETRETPNCTELWIAIFIPLYSCQSERIVACVADTLHSLSVLPEGMGGSESIDNYGHAHAP